MKSELGLAVQARVDASAAGWRDLLDDLSIDVHDPQVHRLLLLTAEALRQSLVAPRTTLLSAVALEQFLAEQHADA